MDIVQAIDRYFLLLGESSHVIQDIALYIMTIDTGARACESLGLRRKNVLLDESKIRLVEKLEDKNATRVGDMFGPLKTFQPGTLTISPTTVGMLRKHLARQAERKLAVGKYYQDYGLVFTKEHADMGRPLTGTNLSKKLRRYANAAGVKPITFHGLRHTCATLLLSKGNISPKVVQERLRHKHIAMTMDIYAHVMPNMQDAAAEVMEGILQVR